MADADIEVLTFQHRGGVYETVRISADLIDTEHVVPPAGEKYAFDRRIYRHNIEVTISPTGRSVQIHANGTKVYP